MTDTDDTGTDVSDVESTESGFQPEQLQNRGGGGGQHQKNGSMVVKHRTNSSLGNHLDLVNRMVSRWGSMGDTELDGIADEVGDATDSDYDDDNKDEDGKAKKKKKPPQPAEAATATATATAGADGNALQQPPMHKRKKSAHDEMSVLKAEREALESAFDKYIDPEQNGDVDIDEWLLGLQKLNVQLNETLQRKIYALMDKDDSGFIEKNDFVMFATQRFDNEELNLLQMPILEAVRVTHLHNRTHSNLLNRELSQDWTDYDIELLQHEMTSAMSTMVDTMRVELTQEQEFKQEMEKRVTENPDMMVPENAFKWTPYEVVHWVESLGMERYARYFAQENVDGPMLLEDVTEDLLTSQLGVRAIHAKKIMREVTVLKKAVRGVTDLLLDESEFVCVHHIEDLPMKIAQLAIKEELEKVKASKERVKNWYDGEMRKLKLQIQELEEQIASGGKKKKKKKKDKGKEKDVKTKLEEIEVPQPPEDAMDDSPHALMTPLFAAGVVSGPEPTDNLQLGADDENQNDGDNEDEEEEPETKQEESGAVDGDEEEEEEKTEATQQQQARSSVRAADTAKADEQQSDESESESESDDDEESGRRLLGMSTAQLMGLKRSKRGATPKQINKFLKDLRKKKEEKGDEFCYEDTETIMNWTSEEVAYWIISISFEQYAFAFYSLPIDGDMLIRDMNQESIIEDLGVRKIHSARILRQIDKLRRIINEGFDEDVDKVGITIEPDLERPTIEQIESLQERIQELNQERDNIMKELESKDENDEEAGYFSKKIQELETERNALKEAKEKYEGEITEMKSEHEQQIENLNNTLNEANAGNEELRGEIKGLKKEVRKAKRMANGEEVDDEESEEEEEEQEEQKVVDDEPIEMIFSKEEVEQAISKEMDENLQFGVPQNVLYWSAAEVCNWLKGLQFTPYMQVFFNAKISGDVLTQDIGQRMLKKFNVGSMHIPKLLRCIDKLRQQAREQGVEIALSEEVKNEMDPNFKPPEKQKKGKKEKKKGGTVVAKKVQELEKLLEEEKQKADELQKEIEQKDEQLDHWNEQYEEERKMRIAVELELERMNGALDSAQPSKQKVMELENQISAIEENKIRTMRDLNDQLTNLRIGCRLMQKEIAFLKTKQGFHPIDSLVGVLGYSSPPKY
eukprot:CAMPEP_0197031706 /NCGR_PEP_ID=MMETSP1384-20130603/10628_1 /TAXON_ID=29189 /ORGANISM="Ammonia sp." /LENGTH=1144 /DNA_ID=CAMNT_0042461273 /DNA_START=74 /DNA_END=3508 /DNA_ORIENTATION=-